MESSEASLKTETKEENIYAFSALSGEGEEVPLSRYKGKVLLIVNTASKCGFTPQYAGLQSLFVQYQDRGFAVLGFPCNQFGAQEPGTAADIAQFCETKFGVSFPVFARIEVNGPDAHPLYRYLKRQRSGFLGMLGIARVHWNFTKFLVGRDGKVLARYGPATSPADLALPIEELL
jgi:glutathione peroxidase